MQCYKTTQYIQHGKCSPILQVLPFIGVRLLVFDVLHIFHMSYDAAATGIPVSFVPCIETGIQTQTLLCNM